MQSTHIKAKVAEQIATLGSPKIVDLVVNKLAEVEISRRADALHDGIKAAEKLQRELKKIKPDHQSFNLDGSVAAEGYSKTKIDEKRKLEERLQKVESAINKATDQSDFNDLFNIVAKENVAKEKNDKQPNTDGSESAGESAA